MASQVEIFVSTKGPEIRLSGILEEFGCSVTGRLTRGSHYLRYGLLLAASVGLYFKALYDKKRDEGKSYTVACCVVARKLLVVMRAMWLSEKKYALNSIGNSSDAKIFS